MKRVLIICALLVAAGGAWAEVKTSLAWQGVLLGEDGKPFADGNINQTLEFRLYDSAEGETALWGRTIAVMLGVGTGVFNTELNDDAGAGVSLAGARFSALSDAIRAARTSTGALYLGITLRGSSGEIRPRARLHAVPFAAFAKDFDSAQSDFTAGGTVSAGALTAKSLTIDGDLMMVGNAFVGENVTVDKSLNVTGAVSVSSLNVGTMQAGELSGPGVIPVGGIVIWTSPTIPAGWAVCDGRTVDGVQTPNLTDRFVQGGKLTERGTTGGSFTHRLTKEEMPSHKHKLTTYHYNFVLSESDGNDLAHRSNGPTSSTSTDEYTESSESSRGDAFSILPKYYAAYYIMRIR